MKIISAYKARTNFGEMLNEVYYGGEEFIVERRGKPFVKISRTKEYNRRKTRKDLFKKVAGAWKDIDTGKMMEEIYKARRDGSRKKKFLASW